MGGKGREKKRKRKRVGPVWVERVEENKAEKEGWFSFGGNGGEKEGREIGQVQHWWEGWRKRRQKKKVGSV